MRISDWSSDVCSSDLADRRFVHLAHARRDRRALELYQRAAIIGAHQDPRLGKRLVDRVHLTGIECIAVEAEGEQFGLRRPRLPQQVDPRAVAVIRSEEHTSVLQSLMRISYAVFCSKKKNQNNDCY